MKTSGLYGKPFNYFSIHRSDVEPSAELNLSSSKILVCIRPLAERQLLIGIDKDCTVGDMYRDVRAALGRTGPFLLRSSFPAKTLTADLHDHPAYSFIKYNPELQEWGYLRGGVGDPGKSLGHIFS